MKAELSPERHRRVTEHFLEASELPERSRGPYLRKLCETDPDLGREVRELLQHHEPAAAPSPAPATRGATRTSAGRRWRPALRILAGAVAVAALLLVLRGWTVASVESRLRQERSEGLKVLLEMRIGRIREWAEKHKARAREVVEDPAFVGHVQELLRLDDDTPQGREALLRSPSLAPVVRKIAGLPEGLAGIGFGVFGLSGTTLAAEDERLVGVKVNAAAGNYFRRALLGEWVVSKPYRDRQFYAGVEPKMQGPIMFVGGPVRAADGRIVAVAAFRFSAETTFGRFFELPGSDWAEIFAFDDKGVLLTEPRDPNRLRELGLLSREGGAALNVNLQDPGGDLAAGYRPELAPERRPLTQMARAATAGGSGADEHGYRDLRGRDVLGAWAWLPDLDLGVASESDLEKTLAPASPVRTAFGVLLGLLGLTTAGMFFGVSRYSLRRHDPRGTLGAYVLERRIGKGGMAEVYLARHALLKRPTAVKILTGEVLDDAAVARFEREAQLASRLSHPNTIQVFDYGRTPDGHFYYAMEYLEGLNLAQLVSLEGPLPTGRAVYLLKQICGSLEEAHELGLVHRDIKPANVMVTRRGGLADVVKVLDFGIARSLVDGASELTGPQQLTGTPLYIAPERIRSPRGGDARSDLYSWGAVAFHLLTGRNVFEAPGPTELLYQVLSTEPASPSRLRGSPLPPALEKLVLDCLAKDPAARPASARAVCESLRTIDSTWSQEDARAWWTANEVRIARFASAAGS